MSAGGLAALPPEVNSAWMYAGPGSGSMLAAATAWDRLAAELSSSAASYQAVISGLTDELWHGPASASMATAAVRYAAWMNTTAEQARQAAKQARAAASAFQRAYAATVPPAVIAANRAMLTKLVATNGLGQNSAAIAANEAQYGQMWTQDAAAMYAYAGASAAAATLTPFTVPPQNTNPTGPSWQAAAVGQAAATGGAQPVTTALQQLATAGPIAAILAQINTFLETNPVYQAMSAPLSAFGQLLVASGRDARGGRFPLRALGPVFRHWFPNIQGGEPASALMSDVSGEALRSTLVGSHGSPVRPAGGGGVSAGLGRAAAVGSLSVPQAWGTPIRLTSAASSLPVDGLVGSPPAWVAGLDGCYGGMLPVAGVMDAPRTAAAGLQNSARGKPAAQLAEAAGAHRETSSRVQLNRGIPAVVRSLSDRERAELEALRNQVAELLKQRDEAARTIRNAIRP